MRYLRSSPISFALALALGALAFPLSQTPAQAQTASSIQTFSIPAQSLDTALNELARQAGLQLMVGAQHVAGKQAPAVSGSMTVRQALESVLAGSGLAADIQGERVIVHSVSELSDNTTTLAPVLVQAEYDGVTEGTGSYTQTGSSSTATGLNLSLRETPQSITVVTRQKMDDFNLDTLAQVMNQTPGVNVSSEGDQVFFTSRGEKIQNFQTDGARQQEQSSGHAGGLSYTFDDMANIDRVDILKGSAGLLQGDGYPSATVNMVRKKPTREFQAHIGAGVGSWDNYRTDLDVSGPLTESGRIRGRSVLSYNDGKSFRDFVHNKGLLAYGTLDIDLTPQTLLNIGAEYRKRQVKGHRAIFGAMAYDTDGNFQGWTPRSWNNGAPWSGYDQHSLNLFATLEHTFSNGWKGRLQANHESIRTPDFFYGVLQHPAYARVRNVQDLEQKTKNISIDLQGPFNLFGRKHELLVGWNFGRYSWEMNALEWSFFSGQIADYANSFDYLDGAGGFPQPEKPGAGDNVIYDPYSYQTLRRGAYATARFNLHDDVKLIAGARVSDYVYDYQWANNLWNLGSTTQIREKRVVTPYAGLVYDVLPHASLYASYAQVFQPQTARDESGAVLDPQEGVTYELGAKGEFLDGRLNASLAVFWKRWEKVAVPSGGFVLGDPNVPAYRNQNGVMERGYELELSGELAPGWQLQGGYVMNNSEVNTYSTSVLPKHQFKLNTTYKLRGALSGLTLGLGARWQSSTKSQQFERKLQQKAYWLVDAMATYRFNKHASASLNINNVFDKKYFSNVSYLYGYGEYYNWGAPRSFNLSVRYDF